MFDDWEPGALIFIGVVVVAVFVGSVWWMISASAEEQQKWHRFRAAHDCRIIGHTEGSWSTGVTSRGRAAFVRSPDQDTWLCDDGITYTRERE